MQSWFNKQLKFHLSALKVVLGGFGGILGYIFARIMIFKPEGLFIAQANAWGDWPVHISLVNTFAQKPISEWFLYHPFFAYGKLTYGFLVHLITALLIKLGFRIDLAFFLVSLGLIITFLTGIYLFYYQLTRSRKQAILGIFIFFTASGMGVVRYFNQVSFQQLLQPTQDYTRFVEYNWLAGNILEGMIIPQRAFFIGIAIGIWVLNLLLLGLSQKEITKQKQVFVLAGVLAGVLPIAHMHSFIAIVIVTGSICLLNKNKLKQLSYFILPAGIISTTLYLIFINHGIEVNNFIRIMLGWSIAQVTTSYPKLIAWIVMWLKLWGSFIPLVISSLIYLKNTQLLKRYYSVYLGFTALFIIANVVVFQPTVWDNTKLFAWVYLGFSSLISQFLVTLWNKKGKVLKIMVIASLITLSGTGSLEILRVLNFQQNTFLLSTASEIKLGQEIANKTATNAVFLTSPTHNHPIPMWANRPIFIGYLGWIRNFGFNPELRTQQLYTVFEGKPLANQVIINNKISYIFVGPKEKRYFKLNYNYLKQFPVAFKNQDTTVYDTRKLWQK